MTIASAVRRHQTAIVAQAEQSADAADRAVRRVWSDLLAAVKAGGTWHDVHKRARRILAGLAGALVADMEADLEAAARVSHSRTVAAVVAGTTLADRRAAVAKRGLLEGPAADSLASPPVVPLHAWTPTAADRAAIVAVFGRDVDPGTLAAAVNAVDGSTVEIIRVSENTIHVKTTGPGTKADRVFTRDKSGAVRVENGWFENDKTKGAAQAGADVLANQVRALGELGVKSITLTASGSAAGDLAGYYAWARAGFDGQIKPDTFATLPPEIKAAMGRSRSVQKLMGLPNGPAVWRQYGTTYEGKFSLAPGSPNMKALGSYLDERAARAKAAGQPSGPTPPPGVSGLTLPPPSQSQIDRIVRSSGWQSRIAASTRLASPEALATQIAAGLANGRTVQQIARDIAPMLEGVQASARRVARTEGVRVAHEVQMEAYAELGDLVIGYTIRAVSGNPYSRDWHVKRSGTKYYRDPKPGQKGFRQMPRPPMEAEDPAERPAGASPVAFNCLCWLEPILDV